MSKPTPDKRISIASPLNLHKQEEVAGRIGARVHNTSSCTLKPRHLEEAHEEGANSSRQTIAEAKSGKFANLHGKSCMAGYENMDGPFDRMRSRTPVPDEPFISSTRILETAVRRASDPELHDLELEPGAEIVFVARLRFDGTTPVMLDRSIYPKSLFQGIHPAMGISSRKSKLGQACGEEIYVSKASLSTLPASEEDAAWLHLTAGQPVFKVERIVFSSTLAPLERRITTCDIRKYRYVASKESL